MAHKRTFLLLEQLILKHSADESCVNVKEMHEVCVGMGVGACARRGLLARGLPGRGSARLFLSMFGFL